MVKLEPQDKRKHVMALIALLAVIGLWVWQLVTTWKVDSEIYWILWGMILWFPAKQILDRLNNK